MKKTHSKSGPAEEKWACEKVKRYLAQNFCTCFHMAFNG